MGDSRLNVAEISNLGIIEVAGRDAEKFLQGQISANLAHANGIFAPLGVFCTPKGRIIANAQLLKVDTEQYWLVCEASICDTLNAHLSKYGVFFKAEIKQREDVYLYGISGDEALALKTLSLDALPSVTGEVSSTNNGFIIKASGEDRWLLLASSPLAIDDDAIETDANHWQLEDIQQGLVWIGEQQTNAWLPQMINWEAQGGISFKKGCYTGQEVVARAHFRGQVKKRLAHFTVKGDTAVAPGDSVVDTAKERSIGTVLASARNGDGSNFLAVVTLSDNPRSLTINETAVQEQPLPYAVERVDPEYMLEQINNKAD